MRPFAALVGVQVLTQFVTLITFLPLYASVKFTPSAVKFVNSH